MRRTIRALVSMLACVAATAIVTPVAQAVEYSKCTLCAGVSIPQVHDGVVAVFTEPTMHDDAGPDAQVSPWIGMGGHFNHYAATHTPVTWPDGSQSSDSSHPFVQSGISLKPSNEPVTKAWIEIFGTPQCQTCEVPDTIVPVDLGFPIAAGDRVELGEQWNAAHTTVSFLFKNVSTGQDKVVTYGPAKLRSAYGLQTPWSMNQSGPRFDGTEFILEQAGGKAQSTLADYGHIGPVEAYATTTHTGSDPYVHDGLYPSFTRTDRISTTNAHATELDEYVLTCCRDNHYIVGALLSNAWVGPKGFLNFTFYAAGPRRPMIQTIVW